MATLKEQFNQSPTMEACNSDIINLVTQMEQLKMTLKQADDEFNSLEQQQVSGESVETLENVNALESKIKQTELENNDLANSMTKMQMDNAAAEDAQEKLKQLKSQLAMQVRYSFRIFYFLKRAPHSSVTGTLPTDQMLHLFVSFEFDLM